MSSAIANAMRNYFSSQVSQYTGELVYVANLLDSVSYSGKGYVDESACYEDSATSYTASVEVIGANSPAKFVAHIQAMGIKENDLILVHFRYDVNVDDNAQLTYNGEVYYVKWAPPAEDGCKSVVAAKTEGQEVSG